MKIAFFSDIHANLHAFKAMLEDLDSQKPDTAYCLGDLVGYNIYPNEVIGEICKRGIATLKGNHDEKVDSIDSTPESLNEKGENYAYHLISEDNRGYLKKTSSPHKYRVYIRGSDFQDCFGSWKHKTYR
ncbi:metallophosphoesterase family protein [Sphingobacterium deserti]|uniref:Metallophosphoesterase n=1 Tax=Sphingobacterium deserti TaxID=1229276 RepID=A0A0B8T522_9SPHI|nr:metallophosphoesterase family protein [Sphingobacterium deserti]KGE12489.1 metallophosphoesterase [Sphingobacterium deserti]